MRPNEYFKEKPSPEDIKFVFNLIPPDFDDQYRRYIKERIERNKVKSEAVSCKSNLELAYDQNVDEIWQNIQKASVIIANLSGLDPVVMLGVGVSLMLKKEKEKIILIADKSMENHPKLPLDISRLNVQFYEPGKVGEFLEQWVKEIEQLITADEDIYKDKKIERLITKDLVDLRREGKFDAALLLLESLDRTEPGNWMIYKEWGITYKEYNDFDNSKLKFLSAINYAKANKFKSEIQAELGVLFQEKKLYDEARKAFEQAESLDRGNALLYEKWAALNFEKGEYHDAMNKMGNAVKLNDSIDEYKWKLEYYQKCITDKYFNVSMEVFIERKRKEKERVLNQYKTTLPLVRPMRDSFQPTPNNQEDFEKFINRFHVREIVTGEIVHVNPDFGVYLKLEFDIIGLIHISKIRKFSNINNFKVGQKIPVMLLYIKFDKNQIDLGIINKSNE